MHPSLVTLEWPAFCSAPVQDLHQDDLLIENATPVREIAGQMMSWLGQQ